MRRSNLTTPMQAGQRKTGAKKSSKKKTVRKKTVKKAASVSSARKKTARKSKKTVANKTVATKRAKQPQRCTWVGDTDRYRDYHDSEWGVPVHDDHALFECLTLEGAQAGLSWSTILAKREGYRKAFVNFDPRRVARFNQKDFDRLMQNPDIVRNRLKIESTISNAKVIVSMWENNETLDQFFWNYVDGKPLQPRLSASQSAPAQTDLSKVISKDLKKRGFRFVGPTIVYAFMQAIGLVNDHTESCFRFKPVSKMR